MKAFFSPSSDPSNGSVMIGLMKYQVWTLEPKRSKSDVTYCQEVYIYIYMRYRGSQMWVFGVLIGVLWLLAMVLFQDIFQFSTDDPPCLGVGKGRSELPTKCEPGFCSLHPLLTIPSI